jgi:hypothetical protein
VDGDVTVTATDQSRITEIAIGGGLGTNAVGAAIALNGVFNTVKAHVDGATVTSTDGQVEIHALASEEGFIRANTVAATMPTSTGFSLSVPGNLVHRSFEAGIINGANVTANDDVIVEAADDTAIKIAFQISFATGTTAVSVLLTTNDVFDITKAIIESSTVTSIAGGVFVKASSTASIVSVIGSFAVSPEGTAIGGLIAVNIVKNRIEAHISGDSVAARPPVAAPQLQATWPTPRRPSSTGPPLSRWPAMFASRRNRRASSFR